mmetsp:Transcript_21509/g.45988  ORF Transcript_21509/g.45988 Transcript_21509/m.45988 type:complete len:314 (-) Transcript_21509:288-1229(-)
MARPVPEGEGRGDDQVRGGGREEDGRDGRQGVPLHGAEDAADETPLHRRALGGGPERGHHNGEIDQLSPIMDIYVHCVFSTMAEVVPIEFEEVVVPGEGYHSKETVENRNAGGVRPYNDFTPTEKLGFALEMAESLADLHGFPDGVIVHDDVQPCQWLRTPDGHLKLGDFNRATIMQWDDLAGGYCKFNNGEAFANYRAPEEFAVRNLDEQIDVFSFGNNLYGMLTGLWNFYDTDDDGVVQKKLIDGGVAYIDPRYRERSFGERKLVELVEKCWVYDPGERISIFEAVNFLRDAIEENKKENEETARVAGKER